MRRGLSLSRMGGWEGVASQERERSPGVLGWEGTGSEPRQRSPGPAPAGPRCMLCLECPCGGGAGGRALSGGTGSYHLRLWVLGCMGAWVLGWSVFQSVLQTKYLWWRQLLCLCCYTESDCVGAAVRSLLNQIFSQRNNMQLQLDLILRPGSLQLLFAFALK